MRTKIALAATALIAAGMTLATPAAAQDYRYGGYNNAYGAPYGQAYGYGYNRGADPRMLHGQVEEIRRDIHHFGQRGMLTGHEANKLTRRADDLHRRIASVGRYGVDHREFQSLQNRIANLQREVAKDLRDRGNGRDDQRWNRYRAYGAPGYGYGRY